MAEERRPARNGSIGSASSADIEMGSLDVIRFFAATATLSFNFPGFSGILELVRALIQCPPSSTASKSVNHLEHLQIVLYSVRVFRGELTALAVLRAFGIKARTSSSMPENPGKLKESVAVAAKNRITSSDPISISAELADPMLPFLAGLLSSATQKTHVMLAGGTQMAAVLALADSLGYDAKKTAVATTSYVYDDESADFISAVQQAGDVAILVADPGLGASKIDGLRAYSQGFAKEGAGAGGAVAACMLKIGATSENVRLAVEAEYNRTILSDRN